VAKLRYQQELTQDVLVARLQVLQCDITRAMLSNIELQRYVATDKHVFFLAKALKVENAELFRP
jgi:transcriptional regulator with XRE-family HTH domain